MLEESLIMSSAAAESNDIDDETNQMPNSSCSPSPSPSPSPVYLFRSKLPDIDIPDHMPLPDFCLQNSSAFGDKPCLIVADLDVSQRSIPKQSISRNNGSSSEYSGKQSRAIDDAGSKQSNGCITNHSRAEFGEGLMESKSTETVGRMNDAGEMQGRKNGKKQSKGSVMEKSVSYRDVERGMGEVAAGLAAMGVRKGEVVMIMLPNSAEFVIFFLGAAAAAAISATCNPSYTPREILHHIHTSRPSLILTLSAHLPKLAQVHRLHLDLDLDPRLLDFNVMVIDLALAFPSPPSSQPPTSTLTCLQQHLVQTKPTQGKLQDQSKSNLGKLQDQTKSTLGKLQDQTTLTTGKLHAHTTSTLGKLQDQSTSTMGKLHAHTISTLHPLDSSHPSASPSYLDLPFPVLSFSSLLNIDLFDPPNHRAVHVHIEPDDVVALPFSSGTTGLPKGVMLTHRGLVTSITQQVDGENPNMYFRADDVVLCVLPMFHIYSLSIVLCSLRKGATMVIMPKFEIEALLQLVQRHRVTIAPLVPPIVLALARNPIAQQYDLSSIRMIMCGAAPLSKDLEDSLKARVPHAIIAQGYGMTEAGSVLSMSLAFAKHPFPVKPGSCGTVLRNAVVKLIDPKTGQFVSHNQPGEICIKGNQIMKGYLNDEVATSNTIDEDGFLHTGDIGIIDDNDELFIVDRVKEIIKFKGFQVPPAELEGILLTHPYVHDVACIGKKDDIAGEVPIAFVVPMKEVEVTENELKEFVASQVVFYKKLHRIIFVDYIPKSPSGKILRKDLRKRLEAENIAST